MVRTITLVLAIAASNLSTFVNGDISVVPVDYSDNGFELQGFLAEPKDTSTPKPAIVIIPDANGVNEYEQERAKLIASEFGWIGFAADIYGKDKHFVEAREERRELASLYRDDPVLAASRMNAAIQTVKDMDSVDSEKVGMIGYCFGGSLVITYGVTGEDQVVAIASFHGGLSSIPENGPEIKPKLLILSGGDDDASSDIVDLEETFNAGNANWEITRYSGIEHAFTVWDDDRYNAWADTRSWVSMYGFMSEAFGEVVFDGMEPESMNVVAADYVDEDGTELRSYLSLPESADAGTPLPAVVILPDWDGNNDYEKLRATMLAEHGYIGFAADIYGKDLQDGLSIDQRIELVTFYRANSSALFVQRIKRAIEYIRESVPEADPENIGVVGYCFGGTGVIEYAFAGLDDAKIVVSFHGGLNTLPDKMVDIHPYVLVLSGGIDEAHGNQTVLEQTLDQASADWEVTRYSEVDHGFTNWGSPAYSLKADARSWDSTMLAFDKVLPLPKKEDKSMPTEPAEPTEPTSGAQSRGYGILFSLSLVLFSLTIGTCL